MKHNRKQVRQGETVFTEGDQSDSMYVIVEGQVQIVRNTASKPVVIATLEAGAFFGEMAIVQKTTRTATAVATTDTVLMVVNAADLELLLKQRPDVGARMIYTLTQRLRDTTNRVMDEKEKMALMFDSGPDTRVPALGCPATLKNTLQRMWSEVRGI